MKRFAFGILAGYLGLLAGLAAAYGALAIAWPKSLPAPPLSRFIALDEKLRFLRAHPHYEPTMLAIGSSVAWRQIDGAPFDEIAGGPHKFLNGATVSLQIHQTRDLLSFYLERYRQISHVVLFTSLPDFADCTAAPASLLPKDAARAYAFEDWPAAYFYMRYFAPQRFLRSALTLAERRAPLTGDLHIDSWGSGPLAVPQEMTRGLRYGAIAPDPACTRQLQSLVQEMAQRGVALTIVVPPIHPDYLRRYPTARADLCTIVREIAPVLARPDRQLVLMHDDPRYAARDFFDAFHLQWPAVRRFSAELAGLLDDGGQADGPRLVSRAATASDAPRTRRPEPAVMQRACGD